MKSKVRIKPKQPRPVFLAEHRIAAGLSQAQLAQRLQTTDTTIGRWERREALMNSDVMAAVAESLSIEPQDLWHRPDEAKLNAALRNLPKSEREQALRIIGALRPEAN